MKQNLLAKFLGIVLILFTASQIGLAQSPNNLDPDGFRDIERQINDEDINFDGLLPSARYVDENGNVVENTGKAGELGRKIEDGTIGLKDIPIFIVKAIDFFTKLAGSLAILALIYGGGQYMFSEILGTKEEAKKTIMYALGGLAVTMLAWLIINIIKVQLTGVDYFGNLVE